MWCPLTMQPPMFLWTLCDIDVGRLDKLQEDHRREVWERTRGFYYTFKSNRKGRTEVGEFRSLTKKCNAWGQALVYQGADDETKICLYFAMFKILCDTSFILVKTLISLCLRNLWWIHGVEKLCHPLLILYLICSFHINIQMCVLMLEFSLMNVYLQICHIS